MRVRRIESERLERGEVFIESVGEDRNVCLFHPSPLGRLLFGGEHNDGMNYESERRGTTQEKGSRRKELKKIIEEGGV